MKRTPIIRRTPLARSRKPIPKRSKSPVRLERLRLYGEAREEARLTLICLQLGIGPVEAALCHVHPRCEWPECQSPGIDPHHTHGRRGANLYDKTKLRFLCRAHHEQVHHDPKAARALGLLQ